jgi:phospholipid/cholesterol/gamma-HCH transport system permease protein
MNPNGNDSRLAALASENPLDAVGRGLLTACGLAGESLILLVRTLACLRFLPRRLRETLNQMYYYGVSSIAVTGIFALFSGMIIAFNTGIVLRDLGMSQSIGSISAVAFCREWGPVMTAIILTARVGSSMAAEIGTMKISEEIDALEVMGVDPVQYLVLPRVITLAFMTAALTMICDLIGIAGAALVGQLQIGVDYRTFYNEAVAYLKFKDVLSGLVKAFFFGVLIAIVSCTQGLGTRDGARGVGKSTMYAVVSSLVFIIILDYMIAKIFFG